MKNSIKIICHYCDEPAYKPKGEISRQIRKGADKFFCSLSCSASYRNSIRPNRVVEIHAVCPHCKKEFDTVSGKNRKTFCTPSCASRGSITENRLEGNARGGRATCGTNLISVEETLKKREAWKYVRLKDFLEFQKEAYEFEYRIPTLDFVHDLALINRKIVVEFDGDEHESMKAEDSYRDGILRSSGWSVFRIPTKSNAVIPPEVLYPILKQN